jgi:type VI secretion system secreted protein Hcp
MAVQYFLKLQGVEGESTDARHRSEIEVEAWSWGETNSGGSAGGGGGGAGRVTMSDLRFTARLGKASPKLLLACAAGQHIPSAVLARDDRRAAAEDFLTLTLSDVLVKGYEAGDAGAADAVPRDQVSLGFGRITIEYRPQNPDGTLGQPVRSGWDLKANRPA